jgi:hypothetical protein
MRFVFRTRCLRPNPPENPHDPAPSSPQTHYSLRDRTFQLLSQKAGLGAIAGGANQAQLGL